MATEYKLPFTGSEINEKLGKVDELSNVADNISNTFEFNNNGSFKTNNGIEFYDDGRACIDTTTDKKGLYLGATGTINLDVSLNDNDNSSIYLNANKISMSDTDGDGLLYTSDIFTHNITANEIWYDEEMEYGELGINITAPNSSINLTSGQEISLNANKITSNGKPIGATEIVYETVNEETGDYEAINDNITELYVGLRIIFVPCRDWSFTTQLNINDLGIIPFGQRYVSTTKLGITFNDYEVKPLYETTGEYKYMFHNGKPYTLLYDGEYWIVEEFALQDAGDLNGLLPISKGGTGSSTATGAVNSLKSALVDLIYPVGSIYISILPSDPNSLFGGTWERIAGNYFLHSSPTESELGLTGGSTSHNHEAETLYATLYNTGGKSYYQYIKPFSATWKANYLVTNHNETAANNDAWTGGQKVYGYTDTKNHLPPYINVFMWERQG